MKKRLRSIMDTNQKRKGPAVICAVVMMATVLFSGTVFAAPAASQNAGQYIGEAKAKSIALKHVGLSESQVTFIKAHLDYDDGYVVYDVEFYSGNTEYDYEIDAVSGKILEYDHEIEYYNIPKNVTIRNSESRYSSQQTANNGTGQAQQYIGDAKAKSIALSNAGVSESQVRKMKVKLDREHGMMVYEVEFKSGWTEYEYEIDALSGTILATDIEHDD